MGSRTPARNCYVVLGIGAEHGVQQAPHDQHHMASPESLPGYVSSLSVFRNLARQPSSAPGNNRPGVVLCCSVLRSTSIRAGTKPGSRKNTKGTRTVRLPWPTLLMLLPCRGELQHNSMHARTSQRPACPANQRQLALPLGQRIEVDWELETDGDAELTVLCLPLAQRMMCHASAQL